MRLRPIATLIPALIALPAFAQSVPATVLQAGTQLVVVDVVVQDKNGQPLHGLKASDFQVSENGAIQVIRNFEEHMPSTGSEAVPPMKLPEGEFTDVSGVKPGETLNVLLLDTLNTPTKDQAFVRQQLLKYVQSAPPGMHLAIFGLSTHLTLLQSFTADPVILKNAVEHKLIPRASALLEDPSGAGAAQSSGDQMVEAANDAAAHATPANAAGNPSDASAMAMAAANVADFEAQNTAFETGMRVQYTLDAFNTLAHYLEAFQGRKNVIWFSGAFPISILPDPSLNNPFSGEMTKSEEFQQTSALLSRAQVAVYPVDARGLMVDPTYDAANHGPQGHDPRAFAKQSNKFSNDQATEHATMDALADETGGRAFYNTNGIAEAVRKAIDAGSNYYTVAYTPTDRRKDGGFRSLRVTLSGNRQATLTYRKGYLAEKPAPAPPLAAAAPAASSKMPTDGSSTGKPATTLTPEQEAARHTMAAYATAAMARGGPEPQDILFKVRVLPAAKTTEPAIAPGNEFGSYKLPGPYQRYDLDFVALPASFDYQQQPDGGRRGAIEFIAYIYTTDGQLINTADRAVSVRVPADKVLTFSKEPLQFHMEVSSPAKTETYLRIGIRDMLTNRFGVVELPTSALSTLSPPVYPASTLTPANAGPAKPAATPGTAPGAPPH